MGSYWQFTLTGTNTPATVYQDQNLAIAFSTNQVASDLTGSFPPIYLDPSVIYRVQLFNSVGTLIRGPYDNFQASLSTFGSSQTQAVGFKLNAFNEVTVANGAGGTGNALTLNAEQPGGACLKVIGPVPGGLTLEIDNSATTGAQTATFTATNKPGIATSAPTGWLSIKCDGQVYYTPLWRGDAFAPTNNVTQQVLGQTIVCSTVTFNGDGTTTLTGSGASASPSSWYTPPVTGIGNSYWINVTKTGGTGTFSAAAGVWTNITSGGLQIGSTPGGGPVNGTYQLSTSNTGSPVVANGTISCTFTPVLHTYTSGSGTETIPSGAANVTIEVWAAGGGGGGRSGSVCFGTAGPGGGSGSSGRSTYSVAALGGAGSTFNYSVGAGGAGIIANGGGSGGTGVASSVTAGTVTGFTAMTTNGGHGAPNVGAGPGGAGGAAGTGGNAANTAGNAGTTAVNGNQNNNRGGAGINGTVSGDGSPYGAGGLGSAFNGGSGQTGAVVFYYT